MSAIEKLTPQDFGRELDIALFSKWKSAYNDAYIQGMFNLVIIFTTPLPLSYLLGFLGTILWFILSFVRIMVIITKYNKVNKLKAQLGINKQEILEAIRRCKQRI